MAKQQSNVPTGGKKRRSTEGFCEIELFATQGIQPPIAPGYLVRINTIVFPFWGLTLSGREIMLKMDATPPEDFILRLNFANAPSIEPDLDERFSLRLFGLETLEVRGRYVQ